MIDFQNKKVFKLSKGKDKNIPKEVFDLLIPGEEIAGYYSAMRDVFKNPYKYCVKRVFCIFYVTYNFTLISFNIWFSIKMIQYFLPGSNRGDALHSILVFSI